jgi:hypothetical protein
MIRIERKIVETYRVPSTVLRRKLGLASSGALRVVINEHDPKIMGKETREVPIVRHDHGLYSEIVFENTRYEREDRRNR